MKSDLESFLPGLRALQAVYETHVYDCSRCDRSRTRKYVLFGQGFPENPDLLLLGDAPTLAQELRRTPYAGEGGAFLKQALNGAVRVYYAWIVCCRSKKSPSPAELDACFPIVVSQIRATQPKAILCLGDIPTKALLKTERKASDLRGWWHRFDGYPVRTTHSLSKITQGHARVKKEFEKDVGEALSGPGN
jgi:uracil-DNA glycosylase family 4